jgi:hypothetical protein
MNFTKIEFRTGEFADDFSLNFPKMEHKFADQSSGGEFANDFPLNFPKIKYEFADQSSGGEFANDFSLNFPKVRYEFADQSSGGDFANDFSLNFPKIEHKFGDQSSGGEFPDAVMIGGVADCGAVEQPSLEQWILDLPQQALEHIVAAGAVQHLPDRIAPTITRDTEGSQTVFGQDGVHDIVVFDAANLGSEMDALVNWDPGEDVLAIVNFTDDDIVGVTVRIPSGASLLNIDGTDVAALGFMRPDDVFSMVATFDNDPFVFI